jgi:serine/threonine protein kinase
MSITPGARIGPYEVVSPLGQGGMDVVYRARDTQLLRDVAVKPSPEHFANDSERLGRFQREAQVLASLNHPNNTSQLAMMGRRRNCTPAHSMTTPGYTRQTRSPRS